MRKPLPEMTREELWSLLPIPLSEHNPNWAAWYAEERGRIVSLLAAKEMHDRGLCLEEYLSEQ